MKYSLQRNMLLWTMLCFVFGSVALTARPWIALFGSADCDQCAKVKAEWLEDGWSEDEAVLVYISIDQEENYLLLKDIEKSLGYTGQFNSFPIALQGSRMAAGGEGFWELADELAEPDARVAALLTGLQTAVDKAEDPYITWNAPVAAEQEATSVKGTQETLAIAPRLLYLSSPGCQKCARQEVELHLLKQKLPGLQVDHYEVTTEEGQVMMRRVTDHFGIDAEDRNLAPLVAWADGYVTGGLATAERLAEALAATPANAAAFWDAPVTEADLQDQRRANHSLLDSMRLTTILLAGLADGVNPCAFATVIFLVSYLLYLKRGRRFVLVAGLLFCIGVFASYLLFGIGLSFIVDYLNRFVIVKRIFYWAFALVGLILAILHLRDALRYRRSGNAADMEMGLNAQTHRKIHDKIHRWAELTGWLALPATVLLGVVVSAMEFACTGQLYLPIIIAINSAGFNLRAMIFLLLYNLFFILPLLAVTVLAYFGIGAKSLAAFARAHVFATKALMALLFLLLAIVMAWLAIGAARYNLLIVKY
ncbi:MAG: hypothetical protein J5654_03640 [Victivallales bacterium]|nr:hypothetical protein [Victivallales bacterium]